MAVLQPGTPFAFYRVEGLIGRGGMGEVYAAYDPRLQRRVALKLLPPERASDPDARLRMLREARSGSALRHPGIVTIYDVGEDAGRVYIAMEWVEGQTLAEAIRKRGKFPVKEALELFRQIAAAVAAAHAAGVLHRDLKTANLMVDAHGRIRVLDFGLSKRMVEHPVAGAGEARTLGPADTLPVEQPGPVPESPVLQGSVRTRVGARMGTPGSSAPELLRGEPADVRSDVFSLGVILYELLTGQPPYRADTLAAMEAAMLREQYLPISRLQPSVPSEVGAVVARALKPEPADRFPGVEAMVAALPSGFRPRPGPLLALGLVLGAGALLFRGWTPAPGIGQPVALTQTGGCAYAPAFIDNQTVVYDDADGADTDLWVVSLAGSAPRRLTDVPGTSWRAAPGRKPGEIVYVYSNPDANTSEGAGVYALDLAGGERRLLAAVSATGVAAGPDGAYYVSRDGHSIRRVQGETDQEWVQVLTGYSGRTLSIDAEGKRGLLATGGYGPTAICVVDLVGRSMACPPTERSTAGRPTWAADGSFFYAAWSGIRRHFPDDREGVVLPAVLASGGLSLAPDQRHLVYSTCGARGPLVEVQATGAVELLPPAIYLDMAAGPDGGLAYVVANEQGQSLLLRDSGGTRQIAVAERGRLVQPQFSRDGRWMAWVKMGVEAGIYMSRLDRNQVLEPTRLTDGEDMTPGWLPDGRLVYSHQTPEGPRVQLLDPTSGSSASLLDLPRELVGVTESGSLILTSPDGDLAFEHDLTTGETRRSLFQPSTLGRQRYINLSSDGRYLSMQVGDQGQRVYRVDLRDPVHATLVYEAPEGNSLTRVAVDPTGKIYAAPLAWKGDLWVVEGDFSGAGMPDPH